MQSCKRFAPASPYFFALPFKASSMNLAPPSQSGGKVQTSSTFPALA